MSTMVAPELEIIPVMVGTAGHVDHGKTALVKLLTGCDTDSLPEEKKRGMSIDLGFAPFTLEGARMVGIIDVPGHEDFIRNMVAGASSIDVLILVVAADDGIMPQTIEHLKIVSLLGKPKVMGVITKIDLVTLQRQQEIKESVKTFLFENGFADAPVILESNKTGEGLDEVRGAIDLLVSRAEQNPAKARAFRMHVERAFSPPGVGTVVTGIPSSGSCVSGSKLELFPGVQATACRAIQKYGHDSREAQAHTCCAITIKDIKASDIERGMTLAAAGIYRETSSAILSVRNVHDSLIIKRRQEMRFCCGTFTRVVWGLLIGDGALKPGERGFMQVESSEPMVLVAGDRFLLRSLSPSATIAGGSVLTTNIDVRRKKAYLTPERLQMSRKAIEDNDPFLSELIAGPFVLICQDDLPGLVQRTSVEIKQIVDEKIRLGVLAPLASDQWLVTDRIAELESKLVAFLTRYHKENRASTGMPASQVCSILGLENQCLEGLIRVFANSHIISAQKNFFFLRSFKPELSGKLQAMKEKVLGAVLAAEHSAIASAVLQSVLNATDQEMQSLVRLLSEEGKIEVMAHYLVSSVAVQKHLSRLYELFERQKVIELGDFRTATGLSRNLAVPVLEFFDAKGITCREGKGRRLLRKN